METDQFLMLCHKQTSWAMKAGVSGMHLSQEMHSGAFVCMCNQFVKPNAQIISNLDCLKVLRVWKQPQKVKFGYNSSWKPLNFPAESIEKGDKPLNSREKHPSMHSLPTSSRGWCTSTCFHNFSHLFFTTFHNFLRTTCSMQSVKLGVRVPFQTVSLPVTGQQAPRRPKTYPCDGLNQWLSTGKLLLLQTVPESFSQVDWCKAGQPAWHLNAGRANGWTRSLCKHPPIKQADCGG